MFEHTSHVTLGFYQNTDRLLHHSDTHIECEYVDNEDDTKEEEPGIVSDENWQVAILVCLPGDGGVWQL